MLDRFLLAGYVAGLLLIASGAGLIYLPAGLIVGGLALAATAVIAARAPAAVADDVEAG